MGLSIGPSPRVWGLPQNIGSSLIDNRSIPTRVGTTSTYSSHLQAASVHPHACGDYRHYLTRDELEAGPSPRVWGLHLATDASHAYQRSIPTRVGTTRENERDGLF